MPGYDSIGVTLDGHVALVEIQRPPHNFFDHVLIRELADAFEQLDDSPACRAIVLAAAGKSFCAGANLGTGSDDGDDDFSAEGFRRITGTLYKEAVRLFSCRKPVIGAIQGAAIGGGLGLALVPDFRIVCPETRFAANFVKLGIHPGFGLTITLPALVGQQTACMMLYTGRRIGGEEALALQLADELTDLGSVRPRAMQMAAEIAANAPLAVLSVRATMRAGLAERVARQTEHELREQQWLRETEDATEGIRAVAERRRGHFTGK